MIDRKDLIKAGVHWGHVRARWCPRMAPYIWGHKDKVHLIDVSKTAEQLEKAAAFLKEVSSEGKVILWVGTKQSARDAVEQVAKKLDQPYVNHRWVGGTLSNPVQVKKSITRLLHFEDIFARAADFPLYTKKDLSIIQKNIQRRNRTVGGLRKMSWPIGALVLVDVNEEASALKEAVLMGVPVVSIVDTNGDPSLVDYVIPANDDTPSSVKILLDYLSDAVVQGKEVASAKKLEKRSAEMVQTQNTEEFDDKDALSVSPEMLELTEVTEQASRRPAGKASAGVRTRSEGARSTSRGGAARKPKQ